MFLSRLETVDTNTNLKIVVAEQDPSGQVILKQVSFAVALAALGPTISGHGAPTAPPPNPQSDHIYIDEDSGTLYPWVGALQQWNLS